MSLASNIDSLTFPLSGTRLIEASAGTGKTYTIAALYVRLILGHGWLGAELLPPDILVVTFTEAATQELRERIRARLTQAAGFFREKTGGDEFLRRLRDDYAAEQWPTCAYRLELAANWMDEAAVYTIHGWCNRMLQQHAFDSGGLFKQEVDTDDRELLNQVVRDYWRQFFYPLSTTACRAVYRLASSPEQLAGVLRPLLFETEALGLEAPENALAQAFQAWEDWAIQAEQLEQAARSLWRDDLPALQNLLNEASANGLLNGNLYRKAGFADKLRQLAAWANGEPLAAEALMKFGQQSLQAGLTKAHQDQAPLFETAPFRAIDDLAAHAANETDMADIITRHAIHWLRARYDAEKQRMARMTFDDMLQRLDLALRGGNGERLAAAIVKQYPLALIDEFQDTDPVQYRIFARLYPAEADSGPGCFMIGDPKQAIYSFRGGDIFTYLKAHQATLGRHYTLSTNFRSTQAMVDAVNRIFIHAENQQAAGAFCFKRQDGNPLPFIPVAAQGREEVWLVDNQAAPALSFWQIADEQAIGMPAYRRQMAAATASEIVRLLHGAGAGRTGFTGPDGDLRPLQPADIAILVRSGHEARLMRQALAERQLRSVYLSERESIYASAEAVDILIWLQALAEPRNERKVRAAIGTATLGWSYQSLRQLALDELAWEQHLERFMGYRERWLQDGILPTLRQLMSDYALPARLQCLVDGERRLTNLLHLAELLQQAGSRLEGEQALIRHLAETIAADQTGEESVIRLESDANLIKIVTIHKSKGLEYPLVFLPFICGFREVGGRDHYYRYHDSEFALHVDLQKSEDSKAGADRERLQEDLRLLYVAITRARYACWLGMAAIKSGPGKASHLHKSAIGYVLGWRAGMAASELNVRLTELRGACPAIDILEAPAAAADIYRPADSATAVDGPRQSTAVIGDDWWIASYSALQTEGGSAPSIEADTFRDDKRIDELDPTPALTAPAAQGIHALPRGAGPGVLVHELMEQCAQLGFSCLQARPELAAQMINSIFKQPDWDNKRETLRQALQQWLTLPLTGADGIGLSGLDRAAYQAEMEFLLGADNVDALAVDSLVCRHTFGGQTRPRLQAKQINGLLKGFIDLVFVHEDRYYVLDYKFNALGNDAGAYSQDKLEQAMLNKRYDLQAVLYLLALHRLLKSRLGTAYAYDRHIGGGVYLFLRGADSAGAGRLSFKPPAMLIEALDRLFCGAATTGIAA
ncbi:exodeoxyribonuclease V subunit beta [Methylomonas sp. SURF-2]|uniref:RecBCD enzyme subunit RecB n=1 Tax=Methylomonas subterranea TaxID=2952225 RepID=A0ABT1THT6_9GAMM|nr:exodeoxyribonuclease V subunit beta [Methylomonas sp. SURF-2]MCQ8105013.1 exodeoxyribonuclease V subunit beta [Methylomonas sp. SURF-2]